MSLTSVIRYVRALDSTATDGSGKTGLAFGDITAKYLTQAGTLTSLTTETITTLGTYQAPTSAAHVRIKELAGSDPTKGVYEVHFHNTQMTDTGKKLWLFLSASGAAFQPLEVELLPYYADVQQLLGTPWLTPSVAGTPDVNLLMTQAVPPTNTAETVGDALNAARGQGFGKWVKNGTDLKLYAEDGTTVIREFTLNDASTPTSRTPL